MTITHELKMDLVRPTILPPVAVVQGDTYSRQVKISLYAAGVAWELPEGHDVAIRYSKPDGTAGKYDTMPDGSMAWRSEGNTVNIMLCPQMLTVPGVVPAQVSIILAERTISTFTFNVSVEPDASKGALASENYINWRTAFLPQLTGAKVGQYPVIAEVDERGMVVAFEAGDAPSGGNGSDSGGNVALTADQIAALDGMFKIAAYTVDASDAYAAFKAAFGISGEVEPDVPEKTLTSISAVYSGGSVTAGTAVTALTGIVVTAHYSDGSSQNVTGYTLSGTIAEGSNTVTIGYEGKTTTFTVVGVAESEEPTVPDTVDGYTFYDYIVNPTTTKDYVDTGLVAAPSFSVYDTQFEFRTNGMTNEAAALGCRNTSGGTDSNASYCWFVAVDGRVELQVLGVDIYSDAKWTDGEATEVAYTFNDGAMSTLSVNGVVKNMASMNKTDIVRNGRSLWLYANNRNGVVDSIAQANAFELGEVVLSDNGNLVYDFVPAKEDATAKYGFYERVNGVFYPCKGGLLTCGNWGA